MNREFMEMERDLALDEIQHINNMIADLQYRVMLLNQKYNIFGAVATSPKILYHPPNTLVNREAKIKDPGC